MHFTTIAIRHHKAHIATRLSTKAPRIRRSITRRPSQRKEIARPTRGMERRASTVPVLDALHTARICVRGGVAEGEAVVGIGRDDVEDSLVVDEGDNVVLGAGCVGCRLWGEDR